MLQVEMFNNKSSFLIALGILAIIAVVTHHSYSFQTFVKMPNGLTVWSRLEPMRR
jgi:hypothetical protein